MRTSGTLKQGVETDEVTNESVDQIIPLLLGEVVPERKGSSRGAITEGISDIGVIGVVPSDFVGNGVGKLEVLGKGTGGDLEIIVGVAPSTESNCGRIIEDRGVGELRAGICEVEMTSAQLDSSRTC